MRLGAVRKVSFALKSEKTAWKMKKRHALRKRGEDSISQEGKCEKRERRGVSVCAAAVWI